MEVDFSIELSADDECLEFPWTDPDGLLRYYDVKQNPELLSHLEEVRQFPALAEFLAAINSRSGQLESVKCDAWFTDQMRAEDDIFGTPGKFGSYVDLIFSDQGWRSSFPEHEKYVRQVTQLLKRGPEIPAMAEFFIRRCYYAGSSDGFYFTFYLFGYGENAEQSCQHWALALKLVENAIRQVSLL